MDQVIVYNVDTLEEFGHLIEARKEDLNEAYTSLVETCERQESNWKDPQYEILKEKLESYAAASQIQLQELEDAAAYIAALVRKLR